MSRKKKEELIIEDVLIESVAAEGKAIAHVDGAVLFVEFAVPGDIVDVRIGKRKKNYMEGRIAQIKKASEYRLEPFCKHFGVCGGCKWQILPYEMQLRAKEKQVWDQFVRLGHLDIPRIAHIIGSDKTQYYRNKLEFTFSSKRWLMKDEDPESIPENERNGLGFHVGKFFDKVLDIEHCYLQREPSNEIRNFIRSYCREHGLEFYDIRENVGFIRNMFVRTNEAGEVMLIICFFYEDAQKREGLMNAISEAFPQVISLYYVISSKLNDSIGDQECILYRGDKVLMERMEGLHFRIGPKSFFQTNTPQAYKLYSIAREFAELSGSEIVYDLYTGTGTIAQFISSKASKVIGIEYVPEAIEDAKLNAKLNGITNCDFFAGDMKDILTDEFIVKHGRPDVIVLDPPRAGIHPDVAKVILNASPKRIVYVSCNPASQARDMAVLCEKYDIRAIQPVDMFPHTHHVETVCLLCKKEI